MSGGLLWRDVRVLAQIQAMRAEQLHRIAERRERLKEARRWRA